MGEGEGGRGKEREGGREGGREGLREGGRDTHMHAHHTPKRALKEP